MNLVLEETSGEELTAEDQRWYQDYLAKRANPAQQGGYQQTPQYQQGGYQQAPQYQQGAYQQVPQYQQGMRPAYQQAPQYQQGAYQQTPQYQQGAYQASGYQSGKMPV